MCYKASIIKHLHWQNKNNIHNSKYNNYEGGKS